jgi:uncharacterized protein YbjT (DUF2867 family)
MNVPAAGQKRLVIVGATGMVGGYALRYALDHHAVERVTAIGRRNLGISHSKLNEVLHQDFADCSALAEALSGQDAAVFCLGTYTGSVSDAELRKVTVDYRDLSYPGNGPTSTISRVTFRSSWYRSRKTASPKPRCYPTKRWRR